MPAHPPAIATPAAWGTPARPRLRRRRRPAGRCTRRVLAMRPLSPRQPTFLSHPEAPPRGFPGFAMRGLTPNP